MTQFIKPFKSLMLGALVSLAPLVAAQVSQPEGTKPAAKTTSLEECIAEAQGAAASAQYGGKTYHFKTQACKEEFLADPERFSQLYDALQELKAQGKPLVKPKPLDNASMVPS